MTRSHSSLLLFLTAASVMSQSCPAISQAQEDRSDPAGGNWYTADCSHLDIEISSDNGLIDGLFRSRTFPRETIRVTGAVIPSDVASPAHEGLTCAHRDTGAEPPPGSDQPADCSPPFFGVPVNAMGRPVALAAKWLPLDASVRERRDYWRWSSLFSGQYFPRHMVRTEEGGRIVPETLDVTIHMYFPDAELTPRQNFPARTLTFERLAPSHCRPAEPRTSGEAGAFTPVQSGAFVYYGDMWIGTTNPEEYIFGHVTDDATGEIAVYYNDGFSAYSGRGYADIISTDAGQERPLPASSFVWTVSTAASARVGGDFGSVRISAAIGSINRAGGQTEAVMTVWEQAVTPTLWLERAFATRIEEGRRFFLYPREKPT